MKILLVYYHPVCFDLAISLYRLGHDVSVAINTDIKDNYGTGKDILDSAKKSNVYTSHCREIVPLNLALHFIRQKKYDLVGCDGVFQGDSLVMDLCEKNNVPWFCIQGYPGVTDELSKNILSFGWFLPTIQYLQKYPNEYDRKYNDWKNIAETGRSEGKNICVFYPQCWDARAYMKDIDLEESVIRKEGYVSCIQRYKECNEFNYKVFENFKAAFPNMKIQNLEGQPKEKVLNCMLHSEGLLHLKQGDAPGMVILESMALGTPTITMSSFIKTSMNQDILIDGYNAIIADSFEELVERCNSAETSDMMGNCLKHFNMITDLGRQTNKLDRFFTRCVEDK